MKDSIKITRNLDRSDVGICNDCFDPLTPTVNEIKFVTMRFRLCNSCLSELEKALKGG